jgi:hypothetical protein
LLVPSGLPAQTDGGQAPGQGRGGYRGRFGGGQPVEGTVTAASGNTLTIKTDAGDSYQITVGDNARVVEKGQAIKLSDIKPGDSVTAMGQVDAANKTVQAMMVIDADNLKITVMRRDNVSQVIAVDDGTSFQRGNSGVAADYAAAGGTAFGGGMRMGGRPGGAQGAPPAPESITLADIKVGDAVMATGAVKGGTFTVLKMGVSEPGAGGQRRRGADDQAAPGASAPQTPAPPPQ